MHAMPLMNGLKWCLALKMLNQFELFTDYPSIIQGTYLSNYFKMPQNICQFINDANLSTLTSIKMTSINTFHSSQAPLISLASDVTPAALNSSSRLVAKHVRASFMNERMLTPPVVMSSPIKFFALDHKYIFNIYFVCYASMGFGPVRFWLVDLLHNEVMSQRLHES